MRISMRSRLWSHRLLLIASLVTFASTAAAESVKLQATIEAGANDRTDVPVCVVIEVPESLAKVTSVDLSTAKDVWPVGQLTGLSLQVDNKDAKPAAKGHVKRELHLVVKDLKAGKSA